MLCMSIGIFHSKSMYSTGWKRDIEVSSMSINIVMPLVRFRVVKLLPLYILRVNNNPMILP